MMGCFLFPYLDNFVWISIQIPGAVKGPMMHEASAICHVSRGVKQSTLSYFPSFSPLSLGSPSYPPPPPPPPLTLSLSI